MCLYIYIYTYIHIFTYMHMHIFVCECMFVCIYIHPLRDACPLLPLPLVAWIHAACLHESWLL